MNTEDLIKELDSMTEKDTKHELRTKDYIKFFEEHNEDKDLRICEDLSRVTLEKIIKELE